MTLASGYLLLGAGQPISRRPLDEQDQKDILKVVEAAGAVGRKESVITKMPVWADTYRGYLDRGFGKLDPTKWLLDPQSGRLGNLLMLSEPPSNLDSGWVKVTKSTGPFYGQASYESVLASRIAESRGNLRPADVLRMALETCGNDYLLATLTAHNLLKEMAYTSRDFKGLEIIGMPVDSDAPPALSVQASAIVDKLQNLREEGHKYDEDVIGPWYHVFGLLFLGSALTCSDAGVGAGEENTLRQLGVFPYDPPKQYATRGRQRSPVRSTTS